MEREGEGERERERERELWDEQASKGLPQEMWEVVFGYCSPRALLNAETACHLWRDIISASPVVWKTVHSRFHGGPLPKNSKEEATYKSHCLTTVKALKRKLTSVGSCELLHLSELQAAPAADLIKWACVMGHHVILDQIIRTNKLVTLEMLNQPNPYFLHLAAQSTSPETVEILCVRGVDLLVADSRGNTALGIAAKLGALGVLEVLLRYASASNTQTSNNSNNSDFFTSLIDSQKTAKRKGLPLLHQGAAGGYTTIVNIILDRLAIDASDAKSAKDVVEKHINAIDNKGYTPLHYAAMNGHIAMTQLLINRGADVNLRSSPSTQWMTALALATRSKKLDIVNLLLSVGASLQPPVPSGAKIKPGLLDHTAYHLACSLNWLEGVKAFVTAGVPIGKTGENSMGPLHYCIAGCRNDLSLVRYLLNQGQQDVNALDDNGRSVLCCFMKSCLSGSREAFELLIHSGANVNRYDPVLTCSPLQQAFRCSEEWMRLTSLYETIEFYVTRLLELGADIPRENFLTDVMSAALPTIQILFDHPKFVFNKEDAAEAMVYLASRFYVSGHSDSYREKMRLLQKYGADIDAPDSDDTLCVYAVSGSKHLKYLVEECGAKIDAKNRAGYTALWQYLMRSMTFNAMLNDEYITHLLDMYENAGADVLILCNGLNLAQWMDEEAERQTARFGALDDDWKSARDIILARMLLARDKQKGKESEKEKD